MSLFDSLTLLTSFHKYVNSKRVDKSSVPPLKRPDGSFALSPQEKCNLLRHNFSVVFTNDNNILPKFPRKVPTNVQIGNINITEEIVLKFLHRLKPKLNSPPDGIPAYVIKQLIAVISYPLTKIFRISLATGCLPSEWKLANIVPIFKHKGNIHDPSNYRPISLTSVCCKIQERIIVHHLMNFLMSNDCFSSRQHGFLPCRSTVTQLLSFVDRCASTVEQHHSSHVIYIDFAKAFDTVSHTKLYHKLKAYGVCHNLLSWIQNFLTHRYQRVLIDGHLSSPSKVISGVPQGSVLGPLLFLLYINELPSIFPRQIHCSMFADDVRLFCSSEFKNYTEVLQLGLYDLMGWSFDWQLQISPSKCTVLPIPSQLNSQVSYSINGVSVPWVSTQNDLGVSLCSNLRFTEHCCHICKKANTQLNMLFRCFHKANVWAFTKAYCSYVRPVLEYASPVFNPYQKSNILMIEKVQKYFTRRLFSFCKFAKAPNHERLRFLNLEPLELRRLHADLTMYFKIIHGLTVLNPKDFFVFPSHLGTQTRGHPSKLSSNLTKKDVFMYSFFNRPATRLAWNSLPESVINAPNPRVFSKRLKLADLSRFCNADLYK